MNETLMAVGAHADDIEYNVGGTLLKYRARGYEVVYVMATNNMAGAWSHVEPMERPGPVPMMERRKAEAAAAAAELGTEPVHLDHPQRHYNGPDGRLHTVRYGARLPEGVAEDVPTILTAHEDASARERVKALLFERDPEYVLTHGPVQKDMEHAGTCVLVTKAFWEAREAGYQGGLLYWLQGHTHMGAYNARWDTFIDCTDTLDGKMRLAGHHVCQNPRPLREDHPHRVRALDLGRETGCGAAEGYVLACPCVRQKQYAPFALEVLAHTR